MRDLPDLDDLGPGLLDVPGVVATAFDLGLIDLDGVAYRGADPVEHASESLVRARQQGLPLIFVTNNASREPQSVASQLTALGIPTDSAGVLTAAQACARYLGEFVPAGSVVLVVGGAGIRTAVREAGYRVVDSADEHPAAVAQGFGPEVGWQHLAEAAYAIAQGAVHVASNLDLSLPTARGYAPGNGSLVRAVVAATGVEPVSAGKPSPAMYRMAVDAQNARRPLVVGDRLDTDLAGARSGGYVGLHVLTGVSTARDDVLAKPGERPHLIVRDLRGLLEPHRAPLPGPEGWWVCGESAARITDGSLELSEADGPSIEAVRAACAASWAAVDDGVILDEASVPELALSAR